MRFRSTRNCAETTYASTCCWNSPPSRLLDGTGGLLRIAAVPSIALAVVPEAIHRTAADAPQCRFDLQVHSRDSITASIRNNQFDVAFTVLSSQGADVRHLATVEAVCVFHRSSPLARLSQVTPQALADQPFVSLAPSYLSRQNVDAVFLRAGIQPRVFMSTQTAASACGVIRSGYGVTVIDPFSAAVFASKDLLVRPFAPAVRFDYVIAVPGREPNRVLVDAFVGRVRDAIAESTVRLARHLTDAADPRSSARGSA